MQTGIKRNKHETCFFQFNQNFVDDKRKVDIPYLSNIFYHFLPSIRNVKNESKQNEFNFIAVEITDATVVATSETVKT